MTNLLLSILICSVLALVQFVAALPWIAVLDFERFKIQLRNPKAWGVALGIIAGAGLSLALLLRFLGDPERALGFGRLYAATLQIQLVIDFFIVTFVVLLFLWPRGAAVALASFREGVRQPMFWLLAIIGLVLIGVSLLLPYFTFGDDFKMMKTIGYDVVMLIAMLFAIIAAGWSISEEIEGRTAITLISKPLSRRSFLFGKYIGILLAALVMTAVLSWFLNWALLLKLQLDPVDIPGSSRASQTDDPLAPTYDPIKAEVEPALLKAAEKVAPRGEAAGFLRGAALWTADVLGHVPGLIIGFCQVMVLLAITTGLATRLPLVVNLLAGGAMFLLGNLAPVLVQRSAEMQFQAKRSGGGSQIYLEMINFVARLFDNLLPALNLFNLSAAIVRDVPLPAGPFMGYVGSVFLYAILYSGIALLVGLILFEDRDLA